MLNLKSSRHKRTHLVPLDAESAARAAPERREYTLQHGRIKPFQLRVRPSGAKSYIFFYPSPWYCGEYRRYTIGRADQMTFEAARVEAERLEALVLRGIDPRNVQDHAKLKGVSFEAALEELRARREPSELDKGHEEAIL